MNFQVHFDDQEQEITLAGVLRPKLAEEILPVRRVVETAMDSISDRLSFNFKQLTKINNIAFKELAQLCKSTCDRHPQLQLKIIISSVVGWANRKFQLIGALSPNIVIEQYDRNFYPGQGVLEDSTFVPILRAQTKMTWRQERKLLAQHGLEENMQVADICCGIGDFALQLQQEFKPARLVALDHARGSLEYARKIAASSGISGIEYICGDASALLLESDQFDFVTCRHSLQGFNHPEKILKELYRICKPGGRVYITNEKNSHCVGEPNSESIAWTYRELARIWSEFGMDIEIGPKSRRLLLDAGFDQIAMESIMISNLDGNPQQFADVIEAWKTVYVDKMAIPRGASPEFIARFREGFEAHIGAALDPKGYAGWPIWIASGRKPL